MKKIVFCVCIMLLFVPLTLTACKTNNAVPLSSVDVSQILNKIDLADKNFACEIKWIDDNPSTETIKNVVDLDNNSITLSYESDYEKIIIAKNDDGYFLYNLLNETVININEIEFLLMYDDYLLKAFSVGQFYLDRYTQYQVLDYYGTLDSLNLVGGKKVGNETNIYISLPYLDDVNLCYLEANIKLKSDLLYNCNISYKPDVRYITSAKQINMNKYINEKSVSFTYDNIEIELPDIELTENEMYTITYYPQDFTLNGEDEFEVVDDSKNQIELPNVDESELYTFCGWYYDLEYKHFAGNAGDLIDAPKNYSYSLFAKSEIKGESIKLSVDYGQATPLYQNVSEVVLPSGIALSSAIRHINEFNYYKSGYYFDGFYKNSSFSEEIDDSILTADTTVYIKFSKNMRIVVDTSTISNQLFRQYYSDISTLYNDDIKPTIKGKLFVGWYLDRELTNSLADATESDITTYADTIVYPKFVDAKSVDVVLDSELFCQKMPTFVSVANDCTISDFKAIISEMIEECSYCELEAYIDESMQNKLSNALEIPNTVYLKIKQ